MEPAVECSLNLKVHFVFGLLLMSMSYLLNKNYLARERECSISLEHDHGRSQTEQGSSDVDAD